MHMLHRWLRRIINHEYKRQGLLGNITRMRVCLFVYLMVLNATFNNISVISWRSVLLVEGTGENHRPVASHWPTFSHNVVHLTLIEIRTHNIIGCIGSCKSNYHTITATTTHASLSYVMAIYTVTCNFKLLILLKNWRMKSVLFQSIKSLPIKILNGCKAW